jgi:glucokinase
MNTHIALDIGGTTLRVARAENGILADVRRASTPQKPTEALAVLGDLIAEVSLGRTPERVLGGVAGVVTEDGVIVSSPHLPAWNGFELAAGLSERFSCPIELHNDVELATLGEALHGAGQGARIVAHLRLGTGVGGSRVVDGALEKHAYGFEPGHQVIDVASGGTLESFVGGAALAERFGKDPREIAAQDYQAAVPALAAGIWNAILLWSPDVVVLGGSLVNDANGFHMEDVRSAVEKFRSVLPALPEIRMGALGDDAGLHGAAVLLSR